MTERPFTLKGLGCTPEQIAQYVVWRSTEIASYYTRRPSASTSLQLIEPRENKGDREGIPHTHPIP